MTSYTIGFVGLSLPLEQDRRHLAEDAIAHLESLGHKVIVGDTVFTAHGYKTASIEGRVKDLHRFFADPEIDLICNIHGGYNSNEILEFLDYDLIRNNPKPFIGYSDITAVNLALFTKANIPTINGPMLGSYASDPTCFERFFAQLHQDSYSFVNTPHTYSGRTDETVDTGPVRTMPGNNDTASGRLISGNMSTFCLLLGTPYMPDLKDAILVLEYDIVELRGLPTLERFLWQIRHCGIFDEISALVLGMLEPKVAAEQEQYGYTQEEIFEQVTKGYSFPVLYNTQFGHVHPSWIVENGLSCTIDKNSITVKRGA